MNPPSDSSTASAAHTTRVALIGNPNTGKTTLFNALTGLAQRVGNYPGVTVERKIGRIDDDLEVVDLPGTYSLAAKSPDELIVIQSLLGEVRGEPGPDVIVVIIDASNLRRNLYLATQVMELGLPTVVALNMTDVADSRGIRVDVAALASELGAPVVPIVATRGEGLADLCAAIRAAEAADHDGVAPTTASLDVDAHLGGSIGSIAETMGLHDFLVRRAFIDEGGPIETALLATHPDLRDALAGARAALPAGGPRPAAIEAKVRYGWIEQVMTKAVDRDPPRPRPTDRIDAVVTHRVLGLVCFVTIMGAVFVSIFKWAAPFMDAIDASFVALEGWISGAFAGTALAGGLLESLLVDGMVAGVGGVLIFLPQIGLLFLFIAILEDCGYMARAAFLMDRLLRGCGLSGHSFIPMLSSFACAIPGILSARAIRNPRDRLVTILVAPLMSCSARIPVYAIMIGAFIPATTIAGFLSLPGLVFAAMYFLGIAVAIPVALILRGTLMRGETSTFIMELPPYRMPQPKTVLLRVWHAGRSFVARAGTIIFAMSILIWAAGTFPRSAEIAATTESARTAAEADLTGSDLDDRLAQIDRDAAGAQLRHSVLGRLGRAIEPVVEPLGWDWKIGTAAVAAFPARELLVSTLNILYGLEDDEEAGLTARLKAEDRGDGKPPFGVPAALSVMVFIALCAQCVSTLVVMGRETRSWFWPVFAFTYMTGLAYVFAFATYQGAVALGL